jgi:hypothetical protein
MFDYTIHGFLVLQSVTLAASMGPSLRRATGFRG